jgi:hypothetical protein
MRAAATGSIIWHERASHTTALCIFCFNALPLSFFLRRRTKTCRTEAIADCTCSASNHLPQNALESPYLLTRMVRLTEGGPCSPGAATERVQ